MRPARRWLIVVALLTPGALTGCAVNPAVISAPSAALLQECPKPVVDLRTNAGISKGLTDYAEALRLCNIDKTNLRNFYEGLP